MYEKLCSAFRKISVEDRHRVGSTNDDGNFDDEEDKKRFGILSAALLDPKRKFLETDSSEVSDAERDFCTMYFVYGVTHRNSLIGLMGTTEKRK